MTPHVDINSIEKKIELSGGLSLVLLNRLAKDNIHGKLECARNIFLIDSTFKIIWQIQTDFDSNGGSFTNIFIDGDAIKGYRWDGGEYNIDIEHGKGTPALLTK